MGSRLAAAFDPPYHRVDLNDRTASFNVLDESEYVVVHRIETDYHESVGTFPEPIICPVQHCFRRLTLVRTCLRENGLVRTLERRRGFLISTKLSKIIHQF